MTQAATIALPSVHKPGVRPGVAIPHVLLADGDEHSRHIRFAQLSAAGFHVSIARTGFEAIVKASCQLPDLILLDDSLVDLGSAEIGRLLTTSPATADIPVVRLLPGRRVPRRTLTQLRRVAV